MQKKKGVLLFGSILFLIAVVAAVGRLIGSGEDAWLCVNGQWVEHGHPSAPMPVSECGESAAPAATSTAAAPIDESSTKALSSCPEWVNCMPGPDVGTRCIIPPGCENVTQKAY
ncbi:hypothetical protein M1413_02005 [Patescibacteria group bacterium]|nr:hypothetical protein [Patescibacteria group bacterium]MCL5114387.1 hypothetical protein [Patescibacteria group bacterium]